MAYYKKKPKSRIIIPICVIVGLIAIAIFGFSVYMSRNTRHVIDPTKIDLVQLDKPKKGDPIAIIKTSEGTMKAVLYPEYAPKTVENFETLAKNKYYDNTYVYNVEKGVYFNAGAPNKSGALDTTKNSGDEEIPLEYSENLWPLRGAVYSVTTKVEKNFIKTFMNTAERYGGSRFGICNSINMTPEMESQLDDSAGKGKLADAFIDNGGIPNFSQQMTIFAQVYDGFDVIDKITGVAVESDTNYNGYKEPTKNVMIESVRISEY